MPLDLENIAVTTGYVLKAQYFLPTHVNHLFPYGTWDDVPKDESVRRRRDVSSNVSEVILVDNSTGTAYSQYNVPFVVVEEGQNVHNESGRGFASTDDEDELNLWNDDDQVERDSKAAQSYWSDLHNPEKDQGTEHSRWDAYKMLEAVTNR